MQQPIANVLTGEPAVGEQPGEIGRLRCVNCGRDLCGVIGDVDAPLEAVVLTCPPEAPAAVRSAGSAWRCGRCGGRVMFEYD